LFGVCWVCNEDTSVCWVGPHCWHAVSRKLQTNENNKNNKNNVHCRNFNATFLVARMPIHTDLCWSAWRKEWRTPLALCNHHHHRH